MRKFTMQKHVNAAPQRTFEIFTDLDHAAGRVRGIKRIELLTDGPFGKGTRFRETRLMFGREATEVMEITDYQPGRSYTLACNSCGVAWTNTFRFSPNGTGTNVELEMTCQAKTFFARLMSPLAGLMAGAMKKCVDQDMEDLRQAAES